MIFPSKFFDVDASILGKVIHLRRDVGEQVDIHELYKDSAAYFEDVGEFLLSLDLLFVLGKIEFDKVSRVVHYVD